MRNRLVPMLIVTASLLTTTQAAASDHRPPDATLLTGERAQTRSPYTTCWSTDSGGFCADGFPRYRRAIRGRPGEEARIRIPHPARIERVDLDGYARVRDEGYYQQAYGQHRDFPVRIRPNRAGGEIVGWRIEFRLPRREGHLYLDLSVFWRRRGDAFYAFHLELRKTR